MDVLERAGMLLGGRYRVGKLIGAGGMGAVYLAEHVVLGRSFAVKVLGRDLADDPKLCQRFQREARAASRIQHPNIVYISDFGTTDDGSLFLVMEYIPGTSLRHELERGGPLEPTRALRLLAQIADALECAHRAQVVHRDLKPENLVLTEHRGNPDHVKVLDFGVAKILGPDGQVGPALTGRGELFGTPLYMSPEQFAGVGVTTQADIYALGVVAYELVTGVTPFQGTVAELMLAHARTAPIPPSQRNPSAHLSPALDAIVARCLAKEPAKRYGSAREARAAFQSLLRVLSGESRSSKRSDDTDFSSPPNHFRGRRDLIRPEDTAQRSPHRGVFGVIGALDANDIATAEGLLPEVDPERARDLYERSLRELAEGLREQGIGSAELTMTLTRLVQAEERHYAGQAEVALAEAQIAETDQSVDERAARLRYAVIQLSQERARLTEPGTVSIASTLPLDGVNPAVDIDEQIAELERRVEDIEAERQAQVGALERRAAAHRQALEAWVAEMQAQTLRLEELVEAVRSQAPDGELRELYYRLRQLRPAAR